MRRLVLMVLVGVAVAGLVPRRAGAQVRVEDLVFTGGLSFEGYAGNLLAVTVPLVDSTDQARAAVGEFGARGTVRLLARQGHTLLLRFDSGLRQFAATGFELRDYAPREWVGRTDLTWTRDFESGDRLVLQGSARGRDVTDRPPMPLFLQPGYTIARAAVLFRPRALPSRVHLDALVEVETADYEPVEMHSQLDLLDRSSRGLEVGAAWGPPGLTWRSRFYGGFTATNYRRQSSFDPADPYRRDHTLHAGASWTYDARVMAELGIEGVINRSNSRRPEYDAMSARGLLTAGLPWWDMGVNLSAVLTAKRYVHDVPFARLVPGEEADNASVVYMDLQRSLGENLDGALRFGWTRAETDLADSYYSRFGVSFLLNYRPPL